jgi:hypothetical protein
MHKKGTAIEPSEEILWLNNSKAKEYKYYLLTFIVATDEIRISWYKTESNKYMLR